MATTLVIKNADFSVNKLDTVTFLSNPCTGITISQNALTADIGDTETLTATPTPSDTSDAVIWSSSDANVATVSSGVVTAIGIGSATITATCGHYSASCAVTVSAEFNPVWTIGYHNYLGQTNSTPPLKYIDQNSLSGCACAGVASGQYPILHSDPAKYVYPLPKNAIKVRVVAPNCYIGFIWSDSNDTEYGSSASWISGNNASSSAGIADDHIFEAPEGANSFVLTLRLKSGTMTQEALDNLNWSVEFLTE